MAHLVDQASAGAASLFAAAAAMDDSLPEFAAVTRAAAMVSPSEQEYEYIKSKEELSRLLS